MSDYRRFVSYVYAYKNGKKEKNAGFAKVEARNGTLKINIQLENVPGDTEGLDVYAFVRKKEKLFGILLGEMGKYPQPVLRTVEKSGNIRESGYGFQDLSGLWIKGNLGENYITIWDEEPVSTMELKTEQQQEFIPSTGPAAADVSVLGTGPTAADGSVPSTAPANSEFAQQSSVSADPELSEQTLLQATSDPLREVQNTQNDSKPEKNDSKEENLMLVPWQPEQNINGVRAQEAAALTAMPGIPLKYDSVSDMDENEQKWNFLCRTYLHTNPFPEHTVRDCIRITPRELYLFRKKGWNAPKNNFMLHGYYNHRHLLFGQFEDGTYFLGVPGYRTAQEQKLAGNFGFPVFQEAASPKRTEGFGYWCRPLA